MAEHALIATLEAPIGGSSTCVAVKRDQVDKNGNIVKASTCQCARYGPAGSGPGFKKLCQQAGLPIVIAGRNFSTGGQEMARALALPPPMDFSPVDGYDDLGFFERVFDAQMAKPALAALGGGALGGVTYGYLSEMSYFDKSWKKTLLAVGLGFGGGRALWGEPSANDEHPDVQLRRNMAKGHLGAMGSVLGAQLVAWLKDMTASSPAKKEVPDDTTEEKTGTDGLFGRLRQYAIGDSEVDQGGRFADAEVDPENVLAGVGEDVSSWIS